MPLFSPLRLAPSSTSLTLAEVVELLVERPLPMRFSAYDGSSTGPDGVDFGIHLRTPRAVAYLISAPGTLGMTRAYVMGDLEIVGAHPGNPYSLVESLSEEITWRLPDPATAAKMANIRSPS